MSFFGKQKKEGVLNTTRDNDRNTRKLNTYSKLFKVTKSLAF